MRIPESLATLAEYGIIESVVRPLMSGKEAQVYLVISDGEERVAKIYKEAEHRSFKHRAEYTEGRATRNSRDQRAITKRSSHGRAQDEAAWRETEVSIIQRLARAGVRVPIAYNFVDGVLVMELVKDGEGNPAPRLGDLDFTAERATEIYHQLIRATACMLCAGVVHGDLSDFNVLLDGHGPVVIDFPQAVDPAHNPNARKLLLRDVDNLHDFLQRFVKGAPRLPYGEEMWELYITNALTPETPLVGRYEVAREEANVASVQALIAEADRDERRRREALGIGARGGPPTQPQRPNAGRNAAPTQARPNQPARPAQPAGTARPHRRRRRRPK